MKRLHILIAGILLGAAVLPVGWPLRAAAQQQSPIVIEVSAGYDGAYRFSEWFPVTINIANDGPDVRGILEWSFPGQGDFKAFRRAIDLPRGSRKRVTMSVFSRDFARNGRIQLLSDGVSLARQDVPLEAFDQERLLIGIVSSDPALLSSLESLSLRWVNGASVRHLDAELLPEHTAALRGIDILFLHDIDTGALTPAQRDALILWVDLGGQLIVGGGLAGEKTAAGLADILPVEITGRIVQADLSPLARLAGVSFAPTTSALTEARPRAGVDQLPNDAPLIFRWHRGAGLVTFSAFDLASLRGWTGETRMWAQVITPISIFAPGTVARLNNVNLLQNVLQLPALNLPSFGVVFCFLAAYILAIGPINYLVLRRLRRMEWAWLTVPLSVLLFAGGLYTIGFGLRGGRPLLNQIAIVQGVEGHPRGFATVFEGLFSPQRATYRLSFPPDILLSEANGWDNVVSGPASLVSSDTGVEAEDILINIGSIRTFLAESSIDMPLTIQSSLSSNGGVLRGQISNNGPLALEDAMIVRGDAVQQIGTLASGQSLTITFPEQSPSNFPWALSIPQNGSFNRQQLLISLFGDRNSRFKDPNAPSAGPLDGQAIYLLGWEAQPLTPVLVDGQELSQNGLTLYIVRLRS